MTPTKTERAFFRAAKEVSTLSDYNQHKLGCVVVNQHRIISSGHNSRSKCHPIQARIDTQRFGVECRGCVHAETMALIPLIKEDADLSGASIFVYREHKDKTPAMARPCPGCESLIRGCGIRNIYYTTEGGFSKERWG